MTEERSIFNFIDSAKREVKEAKATRARVKKQREKDHKNDYMLDDIAEEEARCMFEALGLKVTKKAAKQTSNFNRSQL